MFLVTSETLAPEWGGTVDANNREYGGVIKSDGTVSQSPAGPVANPLTDPNAHIDIASFAFQSTFHSHPSGNISTGPGSNTIGVQQLLHLLEMRHRMWEEMLEIVEVK